MKDIILKAALRSESPQKVRRAGFVPGVLSEQDTTSTSVQFEAAALNKVIANHGSNAKIWIELGADKKFGFIKDIQRNPTDSKVIHIAVQLVSKDQEVKMQLPISFHGRDALDQKMLQIQVYKSNIDVIGKTASMPDVVAVDIDKKGLGETITSADFHLPEGIRILDPEHEIYAIIKVIKEELVAKPAEVAPAE